MAHMDAVLLIDKPAGMTSFQVVAACRRYFHEKKAGHTGTLDPNARGLMIVLLGRYTKLVPYCASNHKHYTAEFVMGRSYDTEDVWGTPTAERVPADHSETELKAAAEAFLGDIDQVPPMYSAIKIDGRKLYEMARKGETVERKARRVHVSSLSVQHMHDMTYRMDAVVSSGTYIRTLIADYCAELEELGAMSALTRQSIEHLSLDEADPLDDLLAGRYHLQNACSVLDPAITQIPFADTERIRNGRAVRLSCSEDMVILVAEGEPLAAYEKRSDGLYHCVRGLF